MALNPSGWRPEMTPERRAPVASVTGNKALMLEEALIFEIGDTDTTGVDFAPGIPASKDRLAGLARIAPIGLPGLSEPETVRHYTRLSRQNYGIDLGFFPLGSCTMKHNPRLNEKMARLPGFADVHPLQPVDTVQGRARGDPPAGALAGDADGDDLGRDEPPRRARMANCAGSSRSGRHSRRAATAAAR